MVIPSVNVLDNGYFCPSLLPSSGSQSLKSEKVSRLVPIRYTRTFCMLMRDVSDFGSVYPISTFFSRRYEPSRSQKVELR